jgi:hypothetical protein
MQHADIGALLGPHLIWIKSRLLPAHLSAADDLKR